MFQLLAPEIQQFIHDQGWTSLRSIQQQSINHLFSDKGDLIIAAPTASGKTEAAFFPVTREEGWSYNPFLLHHSSISRQLRFETESALKSNRPFIALCTSSLELGIDVGSIDAVGQIDPPASVSSLVQRVGRSGRRADKTAQLYLYTRTSIAKPNADPEELLYPDLLQSVAVCTLATRGWLEPDVTKRHHLSTLCHQVLSMLRQLGGVSAPTLYTDLCARGPFRLVTPALSSRVLHSLRERELIEKVGKDLVVLAKRGEAIVNAPDFYPAFATEIEYALLHGANEIGKIPARSIPAAGETIILSGWLWMVEKLAHAERRVWLVPTHGANPPTFYGDGLPVHTGVRQEMRRILLSNEVPGFLDGML